MILEYLFLDKSKRSEIETYISNVVTKRTNANDICCTYKEFEETEYWALHCEVSKNAESNAVFLAGINEDFVSKFAPIVLINESSEYFNKNLFPLINKFERLLRKFLFLKVVQCDPEKFSHILRDLDKKDFGEIYNILFVDNQFCTSARNKIKSVYTRAEMLEILDELQENTTWDILVDSSTLVIVKDNFEKMKDYRNDVMHAHNIGYEAYRKAKDLFTEANEQLEAEIHKIIEFSQPAESLVEYSDSLYEKLAIATQGIARLGSGMITALEKIAQISASTLTPERLELLEKIALAISTMDDDSGKRDEQSLDGTDDKDGETSDN